MKRFATKSICGFRKTGPRHSDTGSELPTGARNRGRTHWPAKMIISHITLLTGDIATHRLDTIPAGSVEACRALAPRGGAVPGFPAFRVEINAPVFTIFRGREPIVTCAVGQGQAPYWSELVALQTRFHPVKVAKPPAGNWLAVVILPGITNQTHADIGWLGDFERCLAAALLL